MAERTIASLPLGDGTRRFAQWWLAQLAYSGNDNEAPALDDDIASCTLVYEVRPGQGVTCRSSGARIDLTLGMRLGGRDILELMPPEDRATALARHENVAAGGLQFSLRRVVQPGGDTHLLQEIGVPLPREGERTTMSMAYVDVAMLDSSSKLELSPAALDLVEVPLFADLRPAPRLFERDTARSAFARLTLSAKNRALASYWLSLWENNSLPSRAAFQPGRVPSLVGGMCLFEVLPHESVFCRTAGSAIRSALGFNIAGTDWLAQTDPYQRASRLRGFTDVALGLAAATRRRVTDPSGRPLTIDGLMLPFRDVEPGGVRYVLTHDDWRPTQPGGHFAQLVNANRVAAEFRTIRLG